MRPSRGQGGSEQQVQPHVQRQGGLDKRRDNKRARTDDLSATHVMQIGCYTREGESLVPEDVLSKDSEIQAVVAPRHIWVTANGMGITYNASRCVVHKTAGGQSNFDFDLDELEPEQDGDGVQVTGPSETEVVDDDEEVLED